MCLPSSLCSLFIRLCLSHFELFLNHAPKLALFYQLTAKEQETPINGHTKHCFLLLSLGKSLTTREPEDFHFLVHQFVYFPVTCGVWWTFPLYFFISYRESSGNDVFPGAAATWLVKDPIERITIANFTQTSPKHHPLLWIKRKVWAHIYFLVTLICSAERKSTLI